MPRRLYVVVLLGALAVAAAGAVAPFRFTAGELTGELTGATNYHARDMVRGVFHAPFFAPSLYGDPTERVFGSGPRDGLWGIRSYELDAERLLRWWAGIAVATMIAGVLVTPSARGRRTTAHH